MIARTSAHDYHVPLDVDDRIVAAELQSMLVDLVDLSLIAKQAHWTVEGPRAHALHAMFDELAALCRELADDVAERTMAIGGVVEAQAEAIAGATHLEPFPSGAVRDDRAIDAVAGVLAEVSSRARRRMRDTSLNDPVSADVLTQVAKTLDKQLWKLRAQR